jgi:hypothetical protein
MFTKQQTANELGLTLERYMVFEKHTLKKVKTLLHHNGIHLKDIPDYNNDVRLETMKVFEPMEDETDPTLPYIDLYSIRAVRF